MICPPIKQHSLRVREDDTHLVKQILDRGLTVTKTASDSHNHIDGSEEWTIIMHSVLVRRQVRRFRKPELFDRLDGQILDRNDRVSGAILTTNISTHLDVLILV